MDIVQYVRLIRRWLWLILLVGFISGSVSFIITYTQPDTYRAYALIAIGGFIQSPNPDQADIRTGIDLTQTYAQLVRTQTVLESTLNVVSAPIDSYQLNQILRTDIIPSTSLLQLSVIYTDPIMSSDLVNELVNQLILASPTNLTTEQQDQIDRLNEQITSIIQDIENLRDQLTDIDSQLADTDITFSQRRNLQDQRSLLIDQINQSNSNVAQFTETVVSLEQRTNSVKIVESARIPEFPLSKGTVSSAILWTILSTGFVFSLVMLYDYLNRTFHSTEEVSQVLQHPVLGAVSAFNKKGLKYEDKLLTKSLDSRLSDEFRILRTNLLFTTELSNGIYIVTSALPGEGKTTIISNLAISIAASGLNVLLIDADLRKPQIHKLFRLNNEIGLTSLLMDGLSYGFQREISDKNKLDSTNNNKDEPIKWQQTLQSVPAANNLRVLCSGFPTANPTELLGSTIMKKWIDTIQNNLEFDIILIDTPPLLGFPDSAVMSVSLDAKVIPIIKANQTRHESAQRMIERLMQVQANLMGVILNQVNPKEENYIGYSYYSDYYEIPDADHSNE